MEALWLSHLAGYTASQHHKFSTSAGSLKPPLRCQYTKDALWHASDVYCLKQPRRTTFGGQIFCGKSSRKKLLTYDYICAYMYVEIVYMKNGKLDTCFGPLKMCRKSKKMEKEKLFDFVVVHSRFVFCVNTSQCIISFSSQYWKSK